MEMTVYKIIGRKMGRVTTLSLPEGSAGSH